METSDHSKNGATSKSQMSRKQKINIMKKIILTFSIVLFTLLSSFAQTDALSPGWYMVKSGAQVKVIQGNSDDAHGQIDWSQITYSANEVLIVFNFAKDKYYCYDPNGRIVMVKGKASLQKIDAPGRPGHINEEVKLGLDHSLHQGNNVWLTGFNPTTKTATILLADGQKAEIPQSSIQDLKEYFDMMDKFTGWHSVE